MGSLSPLHWLVVLAVVLILFGGSGKISRTMGDLAKGLKMFKKNMADDEPMEPHAAPGQIQPPAPQPHAQQPGYAATGAPPPAGAPHA